MCWPDTKKPVEKKTWINNGKVLYLSQNFQQKKITQVDIPMALKTSQRKMAH